MRGTTSSKKTRSSLRIGIDALPPLTRDATDRNRTSPFAFTGNKFEFRSPGSSQSCAEGTMVLNTIIAEAVDALCDKIEKFPKAKFNAELQELLRQEIQKHQRIIFNGDGYTKEWLAEAKRRGLPCKRTTPEAITSLLDEDNQRLFQKYGVYTHAELVSRYEVFKEDYYRRLDIEGKIALEIATNMIRPVAIKEYASMNGINDCRAIASVRRELGREIDKMTGAIIQLREALASEDNSDVIPAMDYLRKSVDALELLIDDDCWPMPKYREMLFMY